MLSSRRFRCAAVVVVAVAAPSFGAGSCRYPASHEVGSYVCLACHDGRSASSVVGFSQAVHGAIDCERCHGPGCAHVRNGGRSGLLIANPAKNSVAAIVEFCGECHGTDADAFTETGHGRGGRVSCIGCHELHGTEGGESEAALDRCDACHAQEVAGFDEGPHNGDMTCVLCHDVHSSDETVLSYVDNWLCLRCHGFFGLGTDAAVAAHTLHSVDPEDTGASRCTSCHMPPLVRTNQAAGPHSHSMQPIEPQTSNTTGGSVALPNSCAGIDGCHDGTVATAPVFDVDDPDLNDVLQSIYDSRYGK